MNNARYVDYMLNAREEQVFEAYGLKLFERATTHQEGWVVSTSQIAFFRPAVPFEEIILESQTIKFIDEVDFEESVWL